MKWILLLKDDDDGNELMLIESPYDQTKTSRKLFPSWLNGPTIIAVLKYLFL